MVIMNLKTIISIYSFITTKILYPLSHLFLQMNQKKPSVGYVRFKLPFYIRQKKKKRKEKERERERNIYHYKLWKILNEMGVPDYLTGLLRSLYVGQEAKVSIGYGITDWFKTGKKV